VCIGCAMVGASAATGFRTWLHTHRFGWLTARRLKALTLAAMAAATIASTVGFSGATPPPRHAAPAPAGAPDR
jgi:hypothetical protein